MKLPVPRERLRERFRALTEDDLAAYEEITRRLLGERRSPGKLLAEVLAAASRARDREAAGLALADDERLALGYVRALEKIQGRTS